MRALSAESKTKEAESVIASLRELGSLRSEGIISDSEFERLKSELMDGGEAPKAAEADKSGGDISGFAADMFRMDDIPAKAAPDRENNGDDILAGIDFSLDKPDDKPAENTISNEDILSGIDFSLDNGPEPVIPEKKPAEIGRSYNKAAVPNVNTPSQRLKEIGRCFSAVKEKYTERDCALMDTESLESLSMVPLFLMGAAAAFFFYYVLKAFAEIDAGMKEILILICLCAGVLPACVIIPNTVKINRRHKCAEEADGELKEFYLRSGCTDIPYEYSSPYVIDELKSIIDDGRADSISDAARQLSAELSEEENLKVEKKQADFSDNDELAARSAALYVLGKKLTADD